MYARDILKLGIVAILLIGCSKTADPISSPTQSTQGTQPSPKVENERDPSRHFLGVWSVRISGDQQAEIVPLRLAEMHLNVVRLLEVAPCTDCLTIKNAKTLSAHKLSVDLVIRHPYADLLQFTGFDVRGIFISKADFTFPFSDRKVARGSGVPKLTNPDGFTPLFNPTEFPESLPVPPLLKYQHGKFATGGDLSSTLNPFVAYGKENPRRMFLPGTEESRTVELWFTGFPFQFGYAVDACWANPGGTVVDPEQDFPPEANCLEAYDLDFSQEAGLATVVGSTAAIHVNVFDHQGQDTIQSVTAEIPALFSGEMTLVPSGATGDDSFLYSGTITNQLGTPLGDYPALIKVTDTESDPNLGNVRAWNMVTVSICDGWAKTWGGTGGDEGRGVAVDDTGSTYVVGNFKGNVDFDPGPGQDIRSADPDVPSAFMSKFDSAGNYQWVQVWPCTFDDKVGIDLGHGVAVDNNDHVYFTGVYQGTVDFDPGGGEEIRTGSGLYFDMFLCRLNSDGAFQWVRTWGAGQMYDNCTGVAADHTGNVYVTGQYQNTIDFDPGAGVENHTSNGGLDAFISKFNSSGDFQWARTWGGTGAEATEEVAIGGLGDVYAVGGFQSTTDFDPGDGVDSHTPIGPWDAFLTKFDSAGDFEWAQTWGGTGQTWGNSVIADAAERIYVAGHFVGTVDFNPGAGDYSLTSNGKEDVFLSRFTSTGSFYWARTWGGDSDDEAFSLAVNSLGYVYVTGYFRKHCDFDPGPGEDFRDSASYYEDGFLSKFDFSGNYQWARTWGSVDFDKGYSVCVDNVGSVYVAGYFFGTVDFDPGSSVENHASHGNADISLCKYMPDGLW